VFLKAPIYPTSAVVLVLMLELLALCHSQHYHYSSSSYFSQNASRLFCHVNNFAASDEDFLKLESTSIEDVTDTMVLHHVEYGKPFVVSGVTQHWRANLRWTAEYFKEAFSELELFSSTFATNASPVFGMGDDRDVYYGIFLNDRKAAESVAEDFVFPSFIPPHLRVQGTEI